MQTIESKYFGCWELRANGVSQHGISFMEMVQKLKDLGDNHKTAVAGANILLNTEVWYSQDNKYKVTRCILGEGHPMIQDDSFIGTTWLNIRINNGETYLRDWAEFQMIKNDLCGEESFGFEIYPPESTLHDTDNCYHMFVLPEGQRFPIGYQVRDVSSDESPHQRLLTQKGL